MSRTAILCVFCFFCNSLFAQSDLLWNSSQKPEQLLMALYASLYNIRPELPQYHRSSFNTLDEITLVNNNKLVDTLIYLNEYFDKNSLRSSRADESLTQFLISHEAPHYGSEEVLSHIRRLYKRSNRGNSIFAVQTSNPPIYTAFLTLADQVDGKFDSRLELPNLERFYSLLVEQKVPLPAICYNCREDEDWLDRRSLLETKRLEKELPKSLLKMRKPKFNEERRLNAINLFISGRILASDDGWKTDYWQTPDETLLVEEGDCEDFAILFCAIAQFLDVTVHVVVGEITMHNDEGILETMDHAWVQYKGRLIDPILTAYRGGIHYEGHFRFNQSDASLILPTTQPQFKGSFVAGSPRNQ